MTSQNADQSQQTAPQQTAATPEAGHVPAAAPVSASSPKPSATPKPRPIPTPAAVAPALREVPAVPSAPVAPAGDAAAASEAAQFGRVADDGTVFVREGDAERAVGQFPEGSPDEALQFYVTRYLDLAAQVRLFATRLTTADLTIKEIDTTLSQLTEQLAEPAAVGDLAALRAELEAARELAANRRTELEEQRAAARAEAIVARTQIVEEVERIADTEPHRMQWRQAGDSLKSLLDSWKAAQRSGPRIDRATEDALWKRFSTARTKFDRAKRHYFAELTKRNAEAKAAKTQLVAEAEKLATSTDWSATAIAFRDLMARWRSAGHAGRKDDDALWARFRAAQDTFFAARNEAAKVEDEGFRANLAVKLDLLTEAEALLPVTDLNSARAALRKIQERWDAAGKVPREDVRSVEGRLRAVVEAVREAEQAQWRRSNPETKARAEGAAAQLQESLNQLESEIAAAEQAGDTKAAEQARAALEVRRSWLEQISQVVDD